MSTVSFPSKNDVRALLYNEVKNYSYYQDLRMVVGCVAPSTDGGLYASQVFPIDLSVGENDPSADLDENTPFLLGSTTKTFTAVAYTLLFAGMIGFGPGGTGFGDIINLANNDLTSVFTSFPALQGRTFADAVTYTAGLKKYNTQSPNAGSYSLQQFKKDLNSTNTNDFLDKEVQVGQYHYSNLGFALLGLLTDPAFGVLNSAIGTDLASVMRSTLLTPLGLEKNTVFFPPGYNGGGVPIGYVFDGSKFTKVQVGNPAFPAYYTGGGITIGGNDLAQWLAFNMGLITGRSASWDPSATDLSYSLPALYTPVLSAPTTSGGSSYPCSGWFGNFNGTTPELFFKDGSLSGASSFLMFDPGPGFAPGGPNGTPGQAGVFVMLNCSTFNTSSGQSLPRYIASKVLSLMQSSAKTTFPS